MENLHRFIIGIDTVFAVVIGGLLLIVWALVKRVNQLGEKETKEAKRLNDDCFPVYAVCVYPEKESNLIVYCELYAYEKNAEKGYGNIINKALWHGHDVRLLKLYNDAIPKYISQVNMVSSRDIY